MKKRLLPMLAVLILLVCALPMVVSADECDHDWRYTANGVGSGKEGTHDKSCSKCDIAAVTEQCTGCWSTGCGVCGNEMMGLHPDNNKDYHCDGCKGALDHVPELKYDGEGHWTACPYNESMIVETAQSHNWDTGIIRTAPTCTTEGVMLYTCSKGCTKTETIPVTHDFSKQLMANDRLASAATCTEPAYYYLTCQNCDVFGTETFTKSQPLGHEWDEGDVTREPTCYEVGQLTYTCSRGCTKTEDIAMVSHIFTKKMMAADRVAVAATCTEPAYYYLTCQNCDAFGTETFTSSMPLGHAWDEGVVVKEATCKEVGQMAYTCERGCTKTEEIPVSGHIFTRNLISADRLASAATCIEPAYYYLTCKYCDEIGTETFTRTKPLGHIEKIDTAVAATCDNPGLTEGSHCEREGCGVVLVEQKATEKLGHDWDDGEVTEKPTYISKGEKTYTCKNDPTHTKTEEIPMLIAASTKGLDDVPKTGSALIEWLYALIFG